MKSNYYVCFESVQLAVKQDQLDMAENIINDFLQKEKLSEAQATDIRYKIYPKALEDKKSVGRPKNKCLSKDEIKNKCIEKYSFYNENLMLSDKNKIIHNLNNVEIIISYLYPNIKYSVFDRKIYINNKPLLQNDIYQIAVNVSKITVSSPSTKEIFNTIQLIANKNQFNILKDYFDNLLFNNTNYIDNWLTLVCGAADTKINRIIGRKWLISCVARACEPGSYIEGSLIFFGKQAAGKTWFFKNINPLPEYYCGESVDISNTQKASQTYAGKFIIEFNELSSLSKASLEDAKRYLTETVDVYVPKYENLSVSIPRMMVFGGSTNDPNILSDTTGNRRFWCCEIGKINQDLFLKIKEDLWAEAYQAFKNKESWVLTSDERDLLSIENAQFESDDPFYDFMKEKLSLYPDNFFGASKLMEIAKTFEYKIHPKTISKVMIKLGFSRTQFTKGVNKGSVCYVRPEDGGTNELLQSNSYN